MTIGSNPFLLPSCWRASLLPCGAADRRKREGQLKVGVLYLNTTTPRVAGPDQQRVQPTKALYAQLRLGLKIASLVWDMNFDSDTSLIDVSVLHLRQMVDVSFEVPLIHTVHGVG